MKIQYKKTVWEDVYVPKSFEKKATKIVKKNSAQISNSILTNDYHLNWDTISDTEEIIEPIDNGGESTVAILDDDGNTIWDNKNGTI